VFFSISPTLVHKLIAQFGVMLKNGIVWDGEMCAKGDALIAKLVFQVHYYIYILQVVDIRSLPPARSNPQSSFSSASTPSSSSTLRLLHSALGSPCSTMASASSKLLQNQFKKIQSEPVEGIAVELKDDNLFEWRVFIEGPKETFYDGGVFQLSMKFPNDYPMSPPTVAFASDFWHPNVYTDGKVCISILHPPGVDEMSGELPGERWLPTQTVTTILLSIISLLSAPNTSSPANVDASVEWRKSPEGYRERIRGLVEKANKNVPAHIKIPHPDTDPVERQRQVDKMKILDKPMDLDDDYDYNDYDNDDDEDDYNEDDDDDEDDGVDADENED